MSELTHSQLVERAAQWLRTRAGCGFVLTEYRGGLEECPDAIGWRRAGVSVLVECKASRADFLADKRKGFRAPNAGLGSWRFYLCPFGLIKPDELAEGWGLLYLTHDNRVRSATRVPGSDLIWRRGSLCKPDREAEVAILASVVRRIELRGDLYKIYEPQPKIIE